MKLKLIATISAFALTAATSASPSWAGERTKIDFWLGNSGHIAEVMMERCAEFNKSQDKYEAVCTSQGGYDKAEQNTITAFRAGQQPTMVQLFDAGTLDFMLSDAIYPADQFVKDFGMKLTWGDYFAPIKSYFATSKGEMWSFPYNHSTAVMYWNKDDWGKVGFTEAPKTWEDFEKGAMAMKEKGVSCAIAFDFDTWQFLEQFSAVHDLPIASKSNGYEGLDAELVFNKTKFVDHVKNYKRWFDAGIAKIQTADTGKEIEPAFADGTCASTITSIAEYSGIRDTAKPGMNWGVAEIPVYAGTTRKNTFIGGAQIWVMKGKKKPEYEAAAAFIDFVSTPEQQHWLMDRTGYIPLTESGYKALVDSGFYKDPKYAGREVAIASLTASEPTANSRGIRLGNFPSVRAEIRAELQAVFTQNKDVQAALDDAVARGNQILRRYEQTYKGVALP